MTRPGRPAKVGLLTSQGLVCGGSDRTFVVRQSDSKRFNRLAGSLGPMKLKMWLKSEQADTHPGLCVSR